MTKKKRAKKIALLALLNLNKDVKAEALKGASFGRRLEMSLRLSIHAISNRHWYCQ